tara:strand:- start:29144 stop:29617 length:474 start_codon:yes stop_codon:yes gene_type:complete
MSELTKIKDNIISYISEIRYDTIICERWRVRDYSGINCTVSLNGAKTKFVHDDDYMDSIEEEKRPMSLAYEELYKLETHHFDDSYWYNDKKNKCMRLWKYSIKNFDDLYLIQNVIWNYLQYKKWKKRWKTDTLSYILLSNKLPLRSVHVISEYHNDY